MVFQGRAGSICVIGPKGQKVCSSTASLLHVFLYLLCLESNLFLFVFFLLFRVFLGWWVLKAWLESLGDLDFPAYQGLGSQGCRYVSLHPCWQKTFTFYSINFLSIFTKSLKEIKKTLILYVCLCNYLCYCQGLPGPAGGAKGEKVGSFFSFYPRSYFYFFIQHVHNFFFLKAKEQSNQKPLETSETPLFFPSHSKYLKLIEQLPQGD